MKLAIFDFDGTLYAKDTLPLLLSKWRALNCPAWKYALIVISLVPSFLQYKLPALTRLSRQEIKLKAVVKFNRLFEGLSRQEIQQYFSICAASIQGSLDPRIVKEVEKAKEEGFHTVLLSGAYHDLMGYIGESLGFDTVIGTKLYFAQERFIPGHYEAELDTEILVGDLKLKKILQYFHDCQVDWQASRSYADSYSDLDILQVTGNPVAVDPDPELKAIALEKGWRII